MELLQLQFYTKPDCPLCDEAKEVLERIKTEAPFIAIDEINITKNMGLFTKYKHLIPVLELDGKRLFVHRIVQRKLMWQLRWHRFQRLITQIGRRGF